MKKSGPKKVTYTYFYCHPCRYLNKKLVEFPLANPVKTVKLETINQYQNSCIHPERRKFNQINGDLVTPVWCPYLNK